LALALAFVGNPDVVVLDEPTSGLDPQMRREVQDQILAMKDGGRAILLATHDMDEAARLCDRVAVIARGRVAALAPPRQLMADYGGSLDDVILRLAAP
jgi:ABC-2 type transport system ATP-binding protein